MMNNFSKNIGRISGGALLGAINGLFGGGGGMLAVPLLAAEGLKPVRAHATAIAVILPVSLVSGIVYALHGFTPLHVLLPTALGVIFGGYLGAKLLGILPERAVMAIFSLLMVAAGVRMLFS